MYANVQVHANVCRCRCSSSCPHLQSAMSVLTTLRMSSSDSFTRVTPVTLMVLVISLSDVFCSTQHGTAWRCS
jgi:hypothetical protein